MIKENVFIKNFDFEICIIGSIVKALVLGSLG